MAYVLQSQIFARGKWALPSPPMPLFWEQPHVPGRAHADVEILSRPLARDGARHVARMADADAVARAVHQRRAALRVLARRRVSSGALAFLAWTLWLLSPITLYFGASYFSETTTTVAGSATGWYALLRWRELVHSGGCSPSHSSLGGESCRHSPALRMRFQSPSRSAFATVVMLTRRWRDLTHSHSRWEVRSSPFFRSGAPTPRGIGC